MATLNLTVGASADDAFQNNTTMDLTTGSFNVDATNKWAGFRFQNVTIPQGATIHSAVLTIFVGSSTGDEPKHTFYGQAADDAGVFTTGASNISSRTRTTANVLWDNADLGVSGITAKAVPDMATVVQEIVNRAGWASGNALVIVCHGDADTNRDLIVQFYDSNPAEAATLAIEYTVGVARRSRFGFGLLGRNTF